MIKVGDTAEVIEITNSNYPTLYENGAWGTIEDEFLFGACSATVGNTILDTDSTWYVLKNTYRKVDKLTVKLLHYEKTNNGRVHKKSPCNPRG